MVLMNLHSYLIGTLCFSWQLPQEPGVDPLFSTGGGGGSRAGLPTSTIFTKTKCTKGEELFHSLMGALALELLLLTRDYDT